MASACLFFRRTQNDKLATVLASPYFSSLANTFRCFQTAASGENYWQAEEHILFQYRSMLLADFAHWRLLGSITARHRENEIIELK